jgi:hypothetical protein
VKPCIRSGARWLGSGIALAAAAYASYAGIAWVRYGRGRRPRDGESGDPQLDRFMPAYEVVERHSVRVAAPAETAFSAACDMDLERSAIIRAIFRARELVLGAKPDEKKASPGLVDQAKAWGWGLLAENPGREIVFGAVTQPWLANPVFQALPPADFAAFEEPGYVKIAWMLRADPVGPAQSVASTETRAATTDPASRAKFRRYWALASPGIILIRWISLSLVKGEAERRARNRSGSDPRLKSTFIQRASS